MYTNPFPPTSIRWNNTKSIAYSVHGLVGLYIKIKRRWVVSKFSIPLPCFLVSLSSSSSFPLSLYIALRTYVPPPIYLYLGGVPFGMVRLLNLEMRFGA